MSRQEIPARIGSTVSLLIACVSAHTTARAEGPPQADASEATRHDLALARFNAGIVHFDRREWDAALAEFIKSRELYPTQSATRNAAVCLRKEGRFDEALELYTALLNEFPELPQRDREFALNEVRDLEDSVGTIDVANAPPGASIVVDGRERGRVPLSKPLRVSVGARSIRILLDGFLPFETRVDVAGRQTVVLKTHLQPLAWRDRRALFALEADGAFGVAPLFGGDVLAGCSGSCSKTEPIGLHGVVHGDYQPNSDLAFAIDAGFLATTLQSKGRQTQILPVGKAANAGVADDSIALYGLTLGGSACVHRGAPWVYTLGVGVGVVLGSVRDSRKGRFTNSSGDTYEVNVTLGESAMYLYVVPEVRFGRRLGKNVEVSIGVEPMLLAAIRQPHFPGDATGILAASPSKGRGDGLAYFSNESLTGSFLLFVGPSVGVRYDF
jgi:hypothetical protein